MITQLDYVGSLIIAGMISLFVYSLTSNFNEIEYQRNKDLISQEFATNMLDIIENDFYKAGYRVTAGDKILLADSARFSFRSDLGNVGYIDTVLYTLGETTELPATSNIHDRPLYRRINGGSPLNVVLGLTRFKFTYLDTAGHAMSYSSLTAVSARAAIRAIVMDFTVEPSDPMDTTFIPVVMQRQIQPKNLGAW